jgi:hypothetical protein
VRTSNLAYFRTFYLPLVTWQRHLRHFTSPSDLLEFEFEAFAVLECLPRIGFWYGTVIFISKAIPVEAWTGPGSFRRMRLPDFKAIGT